MDPNGFRSFSPLDSDLITLFCVCINVGVDLFYSLQVKKKINDNFSKKCKNIKEIKTKRNDRLKKIENVYIPMH